LLTRLPLPDGSAIHVVSVVTDWAQIGFTPGVAPNAHLELADRSEREWADNAVAAATARLSRQDVWVTSSVERGQPAHEIVAQAFKRQAELVVVGPQGLTGLERFLLGSVALHVASHAPCPVLVARPARNAFRRVVLAMDESETAGKALDAAAVFPFPVGTGITVANVVRPYDPYPGLVPEDLPGFRQEVKAERETRHRKATRLVDLARTRLEEAGKHVECMVCEGDATGELLTVAEEARADLIIAGARGVSAIQRLLTGSVADRLIAHAPCSVLLVR
jgi:nucleotide-binding universal stress UspA family protein